VRGFAVTNSKVTARGFDARHSTFVILRSAKNANKHCMVLLDGALDQICEQLERCKRGEKVSVITIGHLLPQQVEMLNAFRSGLKLSHVGSELVLLGRHIHKSRIESDGYSILDVRAQLQSALSLTSVIRITGRGSTLLQSAIFRDDGYGNSVRDEAILELSSRTPLIEVFSVIPKGDKNRPPKQKPLVEGL
jgi:hypothetical protein